MLQVSGKVSFNFCDAFGKCEVLADEVFDRLCYFLQGASSTCCDGVVNLLGETRLEFSFKSCNDFCGKIIAVNGSLGRGDGGDWGSLLACCGNGANGFGL